jgi:hypothetical protein
VHHLVLQLGYFLDLLVLLELELEQLYCEVLAVPAGSVLAVVPSISRVRTVRTPFELEFVYHRLVLLLFTLALSSQNFED